MRGAIAEGAFGPNADEGRRVPSEAMHGENSSDASGVAKHAPWSRECGRGVPMPAESSRALVRREFGRSRARRSRQGRTPESAGLSVRLLASERDIEETQALAVAAHEESRQRGCRFDAGRRRRFLAERFLADPTRYGFLIARHGERAVGMLTCHAQKPYYSDVTVVSCLSFYVLASCRSTLLGGRVALRLLDAGRRWAINRGAVEWQMHVTSGFRINSTDRMLRRVGFRQTGGNYALGLTGEGSR